MNTTARQPSAVASATILIVAVTMLAPSNGEALMSVSPLSALNTTAAADAVNDWAVDVAGDGLGNWVAVHSNFLDVSGDVVAARSSDNGWTWSAPVNVDPSAASFIGRRSAIATDSSGTWVVTWDRGLIATSRSIDNGATWSAPVSFVQGAFPRVATDQAGNWILVWDTGDDLGATIGTDSDIVFVVSTDGGVGWSSPAPVNTDASTDGSVADVDADVATDGAGTWMVVWGREVIEASTSTDNGATWSLPVLVGLGTAAFPAHHW